MYVACPQEGVGEWKGGGLAARSSNGREGLSSIGMKGRGLLEMEGRQY